VHRLSTRNRRRVTDSKTIIEKMFSAWAQIMDLPRAPATRSSGYRIAWRFAADIGGWLVVTGG
jgi:hypothetical protein